MIDDALEEIEALIERGKNLAYDTSLLSREPQLKKYRESFESPCNFLYSGYVEDMKDIEKEIYNDS